MTPFSHPDDSRIFETYRQLEAIGISLNQHYSTEDLSTILKRENRLSPMDIVEIMGGTFGVMPHFHLSDNVWAFDLSDLEDPQSYSDLASRFSDLIGEALPLENIVSDLSAGMHSAWLEFTYKGSKFHWDFSYQDQSIDPAFFRNFLHLMESVESSKVLAFNPKGDEMLMVYMLESDLQELRALTHSPWDLLTLHH